MEQKEINNTFKHKESSQVLNKQTIRIETNMDNLDNITRWLHLVSLFILRFNIFILNIYLRTQK